MQTEEDASTFRRNVQRSGAELCEGNISSYRQDTQLTFCMYAADPIYFDTEIYRISYIFPMDLTRQVHRGNSYEAAHCRLEELHGAWLALRI